MAEALSGWSSEAPFAARPGRVVLRARRGRGPPVVLKATPPGARWSDRSTLRREARGLEALQGEGVVELLDVIDRRGQTALVLGFVPAGTIDRRPVPEPEAAAHRLRAVVDRLHRAGHVHGALRAEHVALDADGLPVLVGFGSTRRSTATTPDDTTLADLLHHLRSGA